MWYGWPVQKMFLNFLEQNSLIGPTGGARIFISPSALGILAPPPKYPFPRWWSSISPLGPFNWWQKPWCFAQCMDYEFIVKLWIHSGWSNIHYPISDSYPWFGLSSPLCIKPWPQADYILSYFVLQAQIKPFTVIIICSNIMVLLLTLPSCRTLVVLSLYRRLSVQRAICCSSVGNRKRSPARAEWQSGELNALCAKFTAHLVQIIFVVHIACHTNPSGGCIQCWPQE